MSPLSETFASGAVGLIDLGLPTRAAQGMAPIRALVDGISEARSDLIVDPSQYTRSALLTLHLRPYPSARTMQGVIVAVEATGHPCFSRSPGVEEGRFSYTPPGSLSLSCDDAIGGSSG